MTRFGLMPEKSMDAPVQFTIMPLDPEVRLHVTKANPVSAWYLAKEIVLSQPAPGFPLLESTASD
jgi:hypothetical protein